MIVALYPETGNIPQYRIKSKHDGHERMVQEDRLDRLLNSVPTKNSLAATFNLLRRDNGGRDTSRDPIDGM